MTGVDTTPTTILCISIDLSILTRKYRNRKFTVEARLQIGLAFAANPKSCQELMKRFDISRPYLYEIRNWAVEYKRACDSRESQMKLQSMQREMDEESACVVGQVAPEGVAAVPDVTVPEIATPEAAIPVAGEPENVALEAAIPDVTVPEAVVPEVGEPESTESLSPQESQSEPIFTFRPGKDFRGTVTTREGDLTVTTVYGPDGMETTTVTRTGQQESPSTTTVPSQPAPVVPEVTETETVASEADEPEAATPTREAPNIPHSGKPTDTVMLLPSPGGGLSGPSSTPQFSKLKVRTDAIPISYNDISRKGLSFAVVVGKEEIRKTVIILAIWDRASEAMIQRTIRALYNVTISEGEIHKIVSEYNEFAKQINRQLDEKIFPKIENIALDEIFWNKPTLTGIDLETLYTILIAPEDDRQKDTWILYLWELKDLGLDPDTIISDACGPILSAIPEVFIGKTVQVDVFHSIKDLGEAVYHFTNRAMSMVKEECDLEKRTSGPRPRQKTLEKLSELRKRLPDIMAASDNVEWMMDWIKEMLGYTGYDVAESTKLMTEILDDMDAIAVEMNDGKLRYAIRKFRDNLPRSLAYLKNLYGKLTKQAETAGVDPELVISIFQLRRFAYGSELYDQALEDSFTTAGDDSDAYTLAEKVLSDVMAHSFRASSAVENLNGRLRPHGDSMRRAPDKRVDLIRLSMNATPFDHSRIDERLHKSAIELATGEKVDFLDLLGFPRTVILEPAGA